MILKDLRTKFSDDLPHIYTLNECMELFSIFAEKLLNLDKITLRLHLENPISEEKKEKFLKVLSDLKTGKPYQQILGEAIFFGNVFFVDENVLIPRPETEELIEIILTEIQDRKNETLRILDIGTGSGCIPITLAKYLPNAEITSIDISEKALHIAKKNADFHQVKINFIQKDYLNENLDGIFDLIVSNPPYIDTKENEDIPFSVKNFEPNIALFAPKNRALAFYEKIASDSQNHLTENGKIFLEINQKLGRETLNLFTDFSKTELLKDLSRNNRFVIVKK